MTILIVDDLEENLYLLETLLKSYQYDVLSAKNGVEAWELFDTHPIDLVISDILMPEMDGFQLCRKVKTHATRKQIPFIIYSATYTSDNDKDFALKIGADQFIEKPCEPDILIKTVKKALKGAGTSLETKVSQTLSDKEALQMHNERLIKKLEKKISDLEQEIEARKRSEIRYQSLFENSMDAILLTAPDGTIFDANPAACNMFGRTVEEIRKVGRNGLIDTTDPRLWKALEKRDRTGKAITELNMIRFDNTRFPAELSSSIYQDSDGTRKTSMIIRDLTERKKTEQAYQKLFTQMLAGFALHEIICNDQGKPVDYRFLAVNPAFEKMTGLKAETVIGSTLREILPEAESCWIERYSSVALTGKSTEFEMPSKALGKTFRVTAYCPDPGQFACIFVDVTEARRAEAEQKKLRAQLIQAQKMESVGRLAGGVAHDFNNKLGVILGYVEFALEKIDENHDLYSDLKEVQSAAKQSADITKQLLAFARKQTISPRQLNLNDTVEKMLTMLRRLIGEDIDLVWKPSAHLWPVKMDPSQIDQILANLSVNARDAIDGVGRVTIETGRKSFDEQYCSDHPGFIPGDFVLLAVSDNGCGMDKDTLDNMFEPFFTTKEVGKGTGLGLATIFGIVKQNNGFINVYSEPGQGSTFNIHLPRLVTDEDIDKAVPEKKAAAWGTETILLVEDDPGILRMTRMMLERKGYTVLSAASPTEAVEKVEKHSGPIDLLMTDLVMPEMNGRDLAGQVTTLCPAIRPLFMSGYPADIISHQGVLDEDVAFIQKPFSMADLSEKVREVLDTT